MDFRQALRLQTPFRIRLSCYYLRMRISLILMLSGLFALFPQRHSREFGKRRLLNVEEAVRLWSEHGTVF
ncbi:MAG TPA: hypothetical protein VFW28_08555 [Micropepsaceae bacterium]|nr:hypothetical protein [Micropepsaceae bacterium]